MALWYALIEASLEPEACKLSAKPIQYVADDGTVLTAFFKAFIDSSSLPLARSAWPRLFSMTPWFCPILTDLPWVLSCSIARSYQTIASLSLPSTWCPTAV
jgi:hypothetical protein